MTELYLPSLPDKFAEAALALPSQIDAVLATLDEANDADGVLNVMDFVEAREHVARRIKADTPVVNALVHCRLKSIAVWAKLSPPEKGGRGKTSKGGLLVFSKPTVSKYRKVGDNAERLNEYAERATEDGVEMSPTDFIRFCGADGNIKSNQNKGVVEWYTPSAYIEAARKVMGSIDLDPATSDFAQKTVDAATFYTVNDDGLAQEWAGTVWLNPPFKMPEVAQFIDKLCESVSAGNVSQAVVVTNNNTDTRWWHKLAEASSAICFTKGRIKWYNAAQPDCSPTNGQTFFYIGRRCKAFTKAFGEFGCVWGKT